MNSSQRSENLQCAEMVIQFCQEKNLDAKIKSCRACENPCHQKKKKKKKKKETRKSYTWRCLNTKCRTWIIIKLLGESTEYLQNIPSPHGKNGFSKLTRYYVCTVQ